MPDESGLVAVFRVRSAKQGKTRVKKNEGSGLPLTFDTQFYFFA